MAEQVSGVKEVTNQLRVSQARGQEAGRGQETGGQQAESGGREERTWAGHGSHGSA